jgi:hypothetical protein
MSSSAQPWWDVLGAEACADDDEAVPPDKVSREEAADELSSLLIDCKQRGMLSAKLVCTIAFWAAKCGAGGLVQDLAFNPSCKTIGHFSRHYDLVAGTNVHDCDIDWYEVPVPSCKRGGGSPEVRDISMYLVHEAIASEIESNGQMPELLQHAKDSGILPRCYYSHPIVESCPDDIPCYPLALYLDGVKCTRTENVLGIWVINLLTSVHHLVTVLRKTELCSCGCRGYCSLFPAFQCIAYSFETLASGILPLRRHDNSVFLESDSNRDAVGGQALGWRAAICFVKGDLAEHCHSLSFNSWNHSTHPCMFCKCSSADMYSTQGLSPVSFPYELKRNHDWETSVQGCEISRDFSADEVMVLKGALDFDRRKQGSDGRSLSLDVCGLSKGDRLEPHIDMPLTSTLDSIHGPARLHFWRKTNQAGVKHRNPLWRADLGIMPDTVLGIDWLHCLSLGVFQDYCASVFNKLIFECNVFNIGGRPSDRLPLAVARLETLLFEFYRAESKRGVNHSRVQSLNYKLFGSEFVPKCDFHGAETNGLVDFAVLMLTKFPDVHQADRLLSLGQSLMCIKRLINCERHVFSAQQIQDINVEVDLMHKIGPRNNTSILDTRCQIGY